MEGGTERAEVSEEEEADNSVCQHWCLWRDWPVKGKIKLARAEIWWGADNIQAFL